MVVVTMNDTMLNTMYRFSSICDTKDMTIKYNL